MVLIIVIGVLVLLFAGGGGYCYRRGAGWGPPVPALAAVTDDAVSMGEDGWIRFRGQW